MAALTQARDTLRKYLERSMPGKVAASTTIYAGAIVAKNAAGYLVPASDTAGLKVCGRADETVDNSTGANGDKLCTYSAGVFKYGTTGASALVQADDGGTAYVLDDQTVVKTAGTTNGIAAGSIDSIDDDGDIWVAIGL